MKAANIRLIRVFYPPLLRTFCGIFLLLLLVHVPGLLAHFFRHLVADDLLGRLAPLATAAVTVLGARGHAVCILADKPQQHGDQVTGFNSSGQEDVLLL